MTLRYAILVGLMTVLFVAWAVLMFRTLLAHRRRAAQRTGRMFPGLGDTLHEWSFWWRSPQLRTERRLLIALTLALMATVVSLPLMIDPAP